MQWQTRLVRMFHIHISSPSCSATLVPSAWLEFSLSSGWKWCGVSGSIQLYHLAKSDFLVFDFVYFFGACGRCCIQCSVAVLCVSSLMYRCLCTYVFRRIE